MTDQRAAPAPRPPSDHRPLVVRAMAPDDCDRVGALRVHGWRHAYSGLVPQTYLNALAPAEDAARHRARLSAARDGSADLVAEAADGTVVGWAAYGRYRGDEVRAGDAELYALYVDPARLGHGIGRILLERCVNDCAPAHRRMLLWVLKGNARARRFYERAGFRADGVEAPFEVAGATVPEVRYVRALNQ